MTLLELEQYEQYIRGIYEEAERQMMATVAKRLARGIDAPGWAEAKLAETAALRKDLSNGMGSLKGKAVEIKGVVIDAYGEGVATAAADIGMGAAVTATVPEAIKALASETVTAIQGTHTRILRSSLDVYRDVVAQSASQVVTGTQNLTQAVQAGLNQFADRGITGFVDSAGRGWDLTSYAQMATRQSTMNAYRAGSDDELVARGYDLVKVSSHGACCPLCRPYEGRVLSLSGGDDRYPSRDDAVSNGLFHVNCRHNTTLFVPGLSKEGTKVSYDPDAYDARMKQRAIERKIRAWKNREAVAVTDPVKARQAKAKVKEWQAAQRMHIEQANAAGVERHGEGWITLKRQSVNERGRTQWGLDAEAST